MLPDVPWPQIRAAFESALQLEPDARERFLQTLMQSAPEIAPRVRRLLRAHERSPDDFLEHTAFDDRAGFTVSDRLSGQIGRYRIERPVGEGGMAVVYRAVLDQGALQRTVALKVARFATHASVATAIATECDILARLTHPHIAHFYDAGLTDDERPFLAMEYVDGLPITAHCAAHALTLDARIRLLQDVCAAVDYAHRNLVVHRDLKPSNVLVTTEGVVKLLDFGIAKVLSTGITPAEELLRHTVPALTPAYAAPEQLRRERVTTAADIWGLGVLAYELISGARPHQLDGLSAAEAERMVCTVDPDGPTVAAQRAGRRVPVPSPSDLDAVILKALRVDPAERYATAGAFAEDLVRALEGRPVRACAPTARYRLTRFVRRHRFPVAATAVAAMALMGATGVAVQQARSARALAAQANAERARSDSASARAQRINRFLQGVLATANPSWYVASQEKGPTVTVLRALELAAARMERELAQEPETRADVHHTLADTYRALGRYEAMASHFDSALAIRERVFRAPHAKIADAQYYAMIGAWQRGQWDRADSLLQAALVMQRAHDEGNNLPYMLETAASGAIRRGEYRRAAALAEESVRVGAARYGPTHIAPVVSEDVLAHALLSQGLRDSAGALAARLTAHSVASGRRDDAPVRIAASLAAYDRRFRKADSLWGELIGRHQGMVRTEYRLLRVRAALLPLGDQAAAARELAHARRELEGFPPPLRLWPVAEVERLALSAQLALAGGRLGDATREARAALQLARAALGTARRDVFWRSRITANEVLARVHEARGERTVAASHWRDALREWSTRDGPATTRDSIASRLRLERLPVQQVPQESARKGPVALDRGQ